jgi:hypothetical protein
MVWSSFQLSRLPHNPHFPILSTTRGQATLLFISLSVSGLWRLGFWRKPIMIRMMDDRLEDVRMNHPMCLSSPVTVLLAARSHNLQLICTSTGRSLGQHLMNGKNNEADAEMRCSRKLERCDKMIISKRVQVTVKG